MKLDDFLISNILFDKALKLGYSPEIEVKRKMIYNFFKL